MSTELEHTAAHATGARRNLDLGSVLGLSIAIAGIALAQLIGGGTLGSLLQVAAFLIVVCGTFGAVMLQTRLAVFAQGLRMVRWVFVPPVPRARDIIEVLRRRFPAIVGPSRDDICYATQNRQAAVKRLGAEVELVLVLGAANSSNARRLREVAAAVGAPAHLINDVRDIRPEWMTGIRRIGVTAGASTPEFLVREVVTFLQGQGATAVRELNVVEEDVRFGLPQELMELSRQSGR